MATDRPAGGINRIAAVSLQCRRVIVPVLFFTAVISGRPYEELVPGFNRIKSHVFIRKIVRPTAANLDFAAYDRNPLLYDPPARKPKKAPGQVAIEGLTFVGALKKPVLHLGATPLSDAEKQQPLAWKPFIKHAWEAVKDDKLQYLASRINSYKWADPLVFQPYQEVTTAYIHYNEADVELWVKVEFAPWVTFIDEITDEDHDGCREMYGKLNTEQVNPDSLAKIVAWARHDYTAKLLSAPEMTDWVTDLASYWYPTRNTDLLVLADDGVWPDARTGRKALRELDGVTVSRPLAVIEGKPVSPDNPMYNVFVVDAKTADAAHKKDEGDHAAGVTHETIADVVLSDNFRRNNRIFTEEIACNGSYKQWEEANIPFFDALRSWLLGFPAEQMGLEGRGGWLFFRKSIDYILGGDLTLQSELTNPLPHVIELKNYLAESGVDLLFVAVPNKEEVYFDRIGDFVPVPAVPLVNPYGRKFLADLQQAGVEVVDLLPAFLKAKVEDSLAGMEVYQRQDTHWSGRGMEIAAGLVAERIKAFSWYQRFTDTVSYSLTDTTVLRLGDLAERLPQERQAYCKPQSLPLRRVINPDKTPYDGNHVAAPLLLIGDSFTGVFELVDCKSAGIGSHIAYRTRIPVDIITSWGGGPMVRQKMLRMRGKYLDRKQVVIYLMVARDLYRYSQGWEPLRSAEP
ncbi:MAG: hypothetical protein JW913_15560 [Chitinispirillaceae bacterium]|nr:hypothetical protein [Chitinispirillaceae bacterium]